MRCKTITFTHTHTHTHATYTHLATHTHPPTHTPYLLSDTARQDGQSVAPYVKDPNTYTDSFFCTSGVTRPLRGALPVVALGGRREGREGGGVGEERGKEGGKGGGKGREGGERG